VQLNKLGPVRDCNGNVLLTPTNESNPWWPVFKQAIISSGNKLAKPEILASTTDARFMREMGIPVFGFSPMVNTPILLHDHNEVRILDIFIFIYCLAVGYLAVVLMLKQK
jgi:aminoacylase